MKVVEQVLVDGDGSESGGCNVAQVTPSTEIRVCANGKCEELKAWVASMASNEWWRLRWRRCVDGGLVASMVGVDGFDGWHRWLASMASMDGIDGGDWSLRHRGH